MATLPCAVGDSGGFLPCAAGGSHADTIPCAAGGCGGSTTFAADDNGGNYLVLLVAVVATLPYAAGGSGGSHRHRYPHRCCRRCHRPPRSTSGPAINTYNMLRHTSHVKIHVTVHGSCHTS